ncbi:MAG TPA: hypothetical protein VGN17_05395 [Bryobacteraceae bacterium]
MTKYEELCGAFRQSSVDGTAYHERALRIVSSVITGFASYLGAPPERVAYLPPEPRDAKMIYSAMGAAKLQEDGWWLAYVRVTLSQGQNIYPEIHALFQFRILVESDKFTVRVGDSKRTHAISDGRRRQV